MNESKNKEERMKKMKEIRLGEKRKKERMKMIGRKKKERK